MLKKMRQMIGYSNAKKWGPKWIPSTRANRKKIHSVRPKLISDETFFEKRKMYLGRLIFVKIEALLIRERIPLEVDSRK